MEDLRMGRPIHRQASNSLAQPAQPAQPSQASQIAQLAKRKRGQSKDAGGVAGAEITGDASLSMKNLVPIDLQVSVPEHGSLNALPSFWQDNLDDGLVTGHVLSSIVDQPPDSFPPLPVPPAAKLKANLTLLQHLGSGHLWDAYHAVLTIEGRVSKDVVAKVACPDTYDGDKYTKEYFDDSQEAASAWHREAALYGGPLEGLQGKAVPLVYGYFDGVMCLSLEVHGGFPVRIELMENVGEPASKDGNLRTRPKQDRLTIQNLYHQLHAARVLHRDVGPRHRVIEAGSEAGFEEVGRHCGLES
ncbi:hypothetical protein IAR50_005661 [Cryptococcus sp. DSM 104548]